MKKFKFDPTKHGYEPVSNFPELKYEIPMMDNIWFIKIICYDNMSVVYWFSAIKICEDGSDDRVNIYSGSFDSRKPANYENQSRIRLVYNGLISTDDFATDLLMHIFGTTKNNSVDKDGLERYNQCLGPIMRDEFKDYYKKNSSKEEALLQLENKLYGSSEAIKHSIMEAIWRINVDNQDVEKVLSWFKKVEAAYYDLL